ncbi:MAG: hypothetical protein Q9226_000381 [Calogaya cf. arnoldii]
MKKSPGEDEHITIFSETGLTSTQAAAAACQSVFEALEVALRKASQQIRRRTLKPGEKIVLSKAESLRWPFLQPNFDAMGRELSSSRATLMLILQVTNLALQKKLAELQRASTMSREEQEALISSIIAMQREQPPGGSSHSDPKTGGSQGQLLLSIQNDSPGPYTLPATSAPISLVDPRKADHPKLSERQDQDHCAERSADSSCHPNLEKNAARDSQPRAVSPNTRGISSTEHETSLADPVKDSGPAIEAGKDLQVWIIVPIVKAIYCGYQMTRLTEQLPLPFDEAQQELHTLALKDERTLTEQLGSLTWKEREFLNAFVDGELPEEVKNRDIKVIIRVKRTEPLVQGHAFGSEVSWIMSNAQLVASKHTRIHIIAEEAPNNLPARPSSAEEDHAAVDSLGPGLGTRISHPRISGSVSAAGYGEQPTRYPGFWNVVRSNYSHVTGEKANDQIDVIQGVTGNSALDEPTSSVPESSNKVMETTTHKEEGMKLVEDKLAPPSFSGGTSLSRKWKGHGIFLKSPTQEPDQVDSTQAVTQTGDVDKFTSSAFNEEPDTTKQDDEGMRIVEEYLARYKTLYDGK